MTEVLTPPKIQASPRQAASVKAPARRFRARAWLAAGAVTILAAGGGLVVWRARAPAKLSYVTQAADRGPVVRAVTASGTVNPVLTIVVGSYVSGVIQDIACDYNTRVRKGQVCATIDPRPYQLTVEQDQAALETATAQVQKDKAVLAYASANADRYAQLVAQDSAARDTAENARSIRDAAAAQLALDQAGVRQHEAALHAAEVNLGYTRIVSPVDGTVVSRNVTIGQTVAASFQTPTLFLIAQDLTKMQVDTNVSESDIEGEGHGVRVGDPASFTVEAFPNRPFRGVVAQVRQAPQTVQNVVTYDVVVAVDNPELKLRPGMTATVKILTDERRDVLRVPNSALRYTPGGGAGERRPGQGQRPARAAQDRVWVLQAGKPQPVGVRIGLQDESRTEIAAGALHEGDAVITAERGAGKRANAGRAGAPLPRF